MFRRKLHQAFVSAMEDILDVYQRPEVLRYPWSVLMKRVNNTSKTFGGLSRVIIGRIRRFDSEYQRNGVTNLFMIFAPLDGFRHVEVTDRRTSLDFAHICRDLVDVHFPNAEKILLVCDNLNTHKSGSLYKAFESRRSGSDC